MKYYFTAYFEDGTYVSQAENDVSLINPQKSSFYDVLEYQKTNRLLLFCLSDGENTHLVDLTDGRFESNGASFYLYNGSEPILNRRLIYFRRNHMNLNTNETTTFFFVGWQGNLPNGENVQYTINFN